MLLFNPNDVVFHGNKLMRNPIIIGELVCPDKTMLQCACMHLKETVWDQIQIPNFETLVG